MPMRWRPYQITWWKARRP